jgi:hypothetical protein
MAPWLDLALFFRGVSPNMKVLLTLLLLAASTWAQPTSSTTLTFDATELGYYPYGQRITYAGTLNSVTPVSSGLTYWCAIDTSTPGEIWVRAWAYVTETAFLAASDAPYTGCSGLSMRVNGVDYPITTSLRLGRRAFYSVGYANGTAPAYCTSAGTSNPRSFGFVADCPPVNRQPSGSFTLPNACETWTDSSGALLKVLTIQDRVYYSANTPFNRDMTLLMANNGVWRLSDCVKVYNYQPDNTNNGNCWFELVPGYENTMTCFEGNVPSSGGQGRIFRYTMPTIGTCGTLPCTIGAGTEIYRVTGQNAQGNSYNYLSKGGTTGATSDGWAVWAERYLPGSVDVGDAKLCAANLAVPVGQVRTICTNNIHTLTGFPLGTDFDYIQLAPMKDGDGRRRIVAASGVPQSMTIWSFAETDTSIRFDGAGPIRSDIMSNGQMKPWCPTNNITDWCHATPHGAVGNAGDAAFFGDGNAGAVANTPWVLQYRLSSHGAGGGTNPKDSLRWQENGGGAGPGGFGGGYIGCSQVTAICIYTNYQNYNGMTGRGGYNWIWTSAGCTGGSCSVATQDPHTLSSGDQIYVGVNTVGIPLGSKPTITVTGASTYTFNSGTVTGSGTGGAIKVETLPGGAGNGIIMVTRSFGPFGSQFINLTTHRNCSFEYGANPFTTISWDGSTFAFGTNNCLVGRDAIITGSTGLGSPRAFNQLDGPTTTVNVVPGSGSLTFSFIAPAGAGSCSITTSTRRDLTSASTATAASGAWRTATISSLAANTPHFWRVACGINEARGIAVTR